MSTGVERVLEQFDRHLKGDIVAAPRPGEPTSPAGVALRQLRIRGFRAKQRKQCCRSNSNLLRVTSATSGAPGVRPAARAAATPAAERSAANARSN